MKRKKVNTPLCCRRRSTPNTRLHEDGLDGSLPSAATIPLVACSRPRRRCHWVDLAQPVAPSLLFHDLLANHADKLSQKWNVSTPNARERGGGECERMP